MGFQRGVATGYHDMIDIIRLLATSRRVTAFAVDSGGSGYAVGDILELESGTYSHQARAEVLTESSGAVTSVRVYDCGAYTVDPTTTGASTTTCSGAGSGCTLDVTLENGGWSVNRNTTFAVNTVTEIELQLQGIGGGSDEIYVGIRSFNTDSRRVRNWELAGFTGFNSGNPWASQPGISPGRYNTPSNGAYVPLAQGKMPFWVSVTSRRILGVIRAFGCYSSFHLGFVNPFATPANFPYPLYVSGCCDTFSEDAQVPNNTSIGSIIDPTGTSITLDTGPGWLRDSGGQWRGFKNRNGISKLQDSMAYPLGRLDNSTPNRFMDSQDQIVISAGMFGNWDTVADASHATYPSLQVLPTPDGLGGLLWPMVPATLMRKASSVDQTVYGEIDGCFWVPGGIDGANIMPEDRMKVGNDRYMVFPTGQRNGQGGRWALKEA